MSDTGQYAYVCGTDKFVEDVAAIVKELGFGAEAVVFEE
jgi:ferredoxin-NADP reductase